MASSPTRLKYAQRLSLGPTPSQQVTIAVAWIAASVRPKPQWRPAPDMATSIATQNVYDRVLLRITSVEKKIGHPETRTFESSSDRRSMRGAESIWVRLLWNDGQVA